MRILHVDTGAEMRGGQQQVLLLMKVLQRAGHVSTLLARRRSPLFQAASEEGFRVFGVGAGAVLRHSGKADVVHCHDARAHSLAALASRRTFVVSRRVAFPMKRSFGSRWKYRKAGRYLAVSRFVADELESGGIEPLKIDVVYDGVQKAERLSEWSAEYPAVALGSSDPQKGRDLVEQAAKVSGVQVLFSDNLAEDLKRASMFLYVTRSEGLGSAALLAMNLGVPVIGSNVGGLAEVFIDGISGIYVRNDPAEIVRAMRRVLGSKSLAMTLVEGGKKRIAERFTEEHLLKSTVACYDKALSR